MIYEVRCVEMVFKSLRVNAITETLKELEGQILGISSVYSLQR